MTRLTNGKLIEILSQNKYLLVRLDGYGLIGINCKVGLINARMANPNLKKLSGVIGYIPCDLMEYITYKIQIITK